MKLVLIGFMGSGKSSVGRVIAKTLDKDFLDMDYLCVTESKRDSISEIFEKDGEESFRKIETRVAEELGDLSEGIISAGGGVVMREETMKELKKNSKIIYLEVKFPTILERISDLSTRPLLKDRDKAKELYEKRLPLYKRNADLIISTDGKNPEQIAGEILGKICMIIGDPVEHSLSPKMHNSAYKALGIDREFLFLSSRVLSQDLGKTIDIVRDTGMRGLTVTLPHKVEVMKFLDTVDPTALKIGAVNTVVNNNGVLKGYNTDYLGVVAPLKKITSLSSKHVALVGAGGAARAALFGLISEGAFVTIYNRTLEKAKELAKEFGCTYASLDKLKHADIYINATNLGLEDTDPLPFPTEIVQDRGIVFDLVYKGKEETKLEESLKKKNVVYIPGIEMLIHQGIPQFKLYTGKDVSEEILRKALYES